MKLAIKKNILLEALNNVSKALSSKNIIPVLSGIKFELTKESLTLTASDNNITIQTTVMLKDDNMIIKEEGSIIIFGRYILDIVRKLPDNIINIEVIDDLKILIYTENSDFNLNGISYKEYPNINLDLTKHPIHINTAEFKDLINQTAFAASNDEGKPLLIGLNFKINDDKLECYSTDSFRLAKKTISLKNNSEENYNIIIPSKNMIELIKILEDDKENIEMHVFNDKIIFKYKNLLFQSRLINGSYPNTANLIPVEELLTINVDKDVFYQMIDRASILTTDKEKNIVTLETNENLLYLKSSSVELGRVLEKLDVIKSNTEEINISFSAKYMMEALKSFNGNKIKLHFVGEVKPILLTSEDDSSLMQLVLPIRTY